MDLPSRCSGRGQRGCVAGPSARRVHRVAIRTTEFAWFSLAVLLAIALLSIVGRWYKRRRRRADRVRRDGGNTRPLLPRRRVSMALAVLIALVFSKYIYLVSLTTYYTFFLRQVQRLRRERGILPVRVPRRGRGRHFIGGPVGDRVGRKYVIWASILGVLPFTLILPMPICSGPVC